MAEAQTSDTEQTLTLRAALELALPYVLKVADTSPTTPSRLKRKLDAKHDYRAIKAALDAAAADTFLRTDSPDVVKRAGWAMAPRKGKRGRRTLNPSLDQRLGALIRTRRSELGWSQQALGQKLNITFQQVQKYENGSNQLTVSRMLQLCAVMDVGPGYFLNTEPAPAQASRIDYKALSAIGAIRNERIKAALLRLARECA